MSRILLLEDDPELGAQICGQLREAGYEVVWWRSGRTLAPEDAAAVQLVILDLMLPGTHGMDILRELRDSRAEVPVLVLSARNHTHDKVQALRLGADDYMTKPYWPEELLERVRARIRRPMLERPGVLSFGPLRLDLAARALSRDGAAIALTRTELDILIALAQRPGEAVTRRWLVEHVLDPEREGTERTLDAHVSRLRKKLGDACTIETVWAIGYRLRAEVSA
ncbi:response regulator transcription factor [Nannocystis radixulma]|uniref:Response regulator transcription factor n=1 Tax=Nannocystis radixulma TaxID=2995305 RepID=A0ABT5BMX3_9BACT|nr:response regulator transcription factor [Nannocystis radixulma]MDC0675447.1 response regulator transcription factor [Nannocystis radixulma]